jgi:hypothetical protein
MGPDHFSGEFFGNAWGRFGRRAKVVIVFALAHVDDRALKHFSLINNWMRIQISGRVS